MTVKLKQAALFAAFYCPRARLGMLTDALIHGDLALQRDPNDPDIFTNASAEVLWRFIPEQAGDTAVVHLALNGDGPASSAWAHCRRRLQSLLSDERLRATIWGYTLVYQAVWDGPRPDPLPDLSALLPHTRRLGASEAQAPGGVLAHSQSTGESDVWLLDVPTRSSEGFAAATVYLALVPDSPEIANDEFVSAVLFGPGAALLMPDLLAHKGYFLMRQYRAEGREGRYKQVVDLLHGASVTILGTSISLRPGETAPQPVQVNDLTALFDEYVALLRLVPTFKRLRAALTEQVENTTRLAHPIGTGDIVPHHAHNLQTGLVELDLLITQGQDMLDAASKAVDLVQAQAEKASAHQQQHIAMRLGVLGVALAVPQIVTWEVACGWLVQWGWVQTCTDYRTQEPLFLQIAVVLLFVGIAWWGLPYVPRWRRQGPNEPRG
jgi:hypothetical protein